MATLAPTPWIALSDSSRATGLLAACGPDRLLVTTDPVEFRRWLASARPRVAILIAPPATDDEEAVVLRERSRRPTLRVVHVTRPDDVERRLRALRRGVDVALTWDIDPDELASRLVILDDRLRVTRTRRRPVAVTPRVVLDPTAHEVRREGGVVHLRPKEYQLIELLAANPGRAFTRRQLLDRVWGPGRHGDPRTVDVHVRWLRAKLEADPAHPEHLRTVRGVGYRLDPTPLTEP
jgi:DNA-binding response OmpR family regulator